MDYMKIEKSHGRVERADKVANGALGTLGDNQQLARCESAIWRWKRVKAILSRILSWNFVLICALFAGNFVGD